MLYTNIIHRVDAAEHSRRALAFQWQEAQRIGIPTTTLLTYPTLFMDEVVESVVRMKGAEDELGLHFHAFQCQRFSERYGSREGAIWLLPRDLRRQVIDEMMAAFEGHFGHFPRSIGGYIIDAWTLKYIKTAYPQVEIAITSCFEEGVKMFYGNNRNWFLFSDGGPWNPYFPSKANALIPASDAAEAIDIVAVPHLNRDMLMALSSRDDWYASHPGNIFRARINDGPMSEYFFRFLAAWERQAELNGWSYLNVFVSSPWMSERHWCIDKVEDARAMYTRMLEYLNGREEAGANRNSTMAGFSQAFRRAVCAGDPTVCHWKDELRQSKRQVVWTLNSHHRCAFDMNRGGALVDMRPYAGRLNGDLGPETPHLYNGNHPFIVSTEHCGGHWNTSQHATVSNGTHTFNITDRRVRAEVKRITDNHWRIETAPVEVTLGGETLKFQSIWEFNSSATVKMHRRVLEYTGDIEALVLTEVFLGRPGVHEYPGDLRGILLSGGNETQQEDLPFTYSGKQKCIELADTVVADLPQLGTRLELVAQSASLSGRLVDGTLFSPSFRIELSYPVSIGKEITTCLRTSPL